MTAQILRRRAANPKGQQPAKGSAPDQLFSRTPWVAKAWDAVV